MIVVNGKIVNQNKFPDGTLNLEFETDMEKEKNIIVEWYYENESELLTILYIDSNLMYSQKLDRELYLMYAPNARRDKTIYPQIDTLEAFTIVINQLNFDTVYIIEPHSDIIVTEIENSIPVWIAPKAIDKILKLNPSITHVVFHDKLSKARYVTESPMTRDINKNVKCLVATEVLNKETGKYKSCILEDCNIENKDILIVDDIVSYGNTVLKTFEELDFREANNIYLYATHIEDSITLGNIPNCGIEKIYCTNSIIAPNRDKLPNVITMDIKEFM